jgi:hypothetical protein
MPISIQPTTITAGTRTTPDTSASDIVGGDELDVQVTGLTAANLADTTLQINLMVQGNDSPNGNQGWYDVQPCDWHGGIPAKGQPAGTFAPCEFSFRNPALHVIQRYRLQYTVNKTIVAGLSVTPQNLG